MATRLLFGGGPAEGAQPVVAADDPARKLVGRLLDDRFQIVDVLGRGGMGVVYEATDHVLERPVVVKVIAPGGASVLASGERLVREARLACRVEHPSIITVFHLGLLETGEPYVVMERLTGRDLGDILAERAKLTVEETLGVLDPVADALEALHEAKIVHRDLKPENVLVLRGRLDRPRVKLIDFGLAMLDQDSLGRMTRAGVLIGTPEYLAPECARGGSATPASDVYSLACIAFELLTGQPPFTGQPMDVLVAKTTTHAPSMSEASDLPRLKRLATPMARALSRDPAQRPGAVEFVRQLREASRADDTIRTVARVAATEAAATAVATTPPPSRTTAPFALAWVALATAVLALITALVSMLT